MPHADALPAGVRTLQPGAPSRYAFSVCTLVTRPDQYARMVQSYREAGFGDDCEFLCIDNSSGNVCDAYRGCDAFLVEAQGAVVILSHQDVELAFDRRPVLEARLREVEAQDPHWGVCGNAGGAAVGVTVMRISDPHGEDRAIGQFPQQVFSLDENFMVVRRAANLSLSSNLSGYHMYGPDLCIMADVKGLHCYVIDFHLRHLSPGTLDDGFRASADALARKYARAFRARWVQTTVTKVFLSGGGLLRALRLRWGGR